MRAGGDKFSILGELSVKEDGTPFNLLIIDYYKFSLYKNTAMFHIKMVKMHFVFCFTSS